MTALHKPVLDLTPDEIINIPTDKPEMLFEPSTDAITHVFRTLSKKWFPDINPDPKAGDVQRHLNELRKSADDKLARDAWQEAGYFTCRLSDGHKFRVRSDISHAFELGAMHISPTTITYVVRREYADLFKNAISIFGSFPFADDKMKDIYSPRLPTVFKAYETPDSLIVTLRKKKDDILLRDLKPHIDKDNLGKHVAWIISRLHEMARYLDYAGISHNAITLDNVFVSPHDHTASLFGGWWYATAPGQSLKAVPAEAGEFLDDEALETGRPSSKVDLEMVRAAGRELLGDRGGTRLAMLKSAPGPMLDYLRLPTSGYAQKDFTHWQNNVLPKSFGARRFTELPVSYSDVYQPKGV